MYIYIYKKIEKYNNILIIEQDSTNAEKKIL